MVYLLSWLGLQALEALSACAESLFPDPSLPLFPLLLAVLCGVNDPGCSLTQREMLALEGDPGPLLGWDFEDLQCPSGWCDAAFSMVAAHAKQLLRHFIFPLWGLQGAVFMCCSLLPGFFFIPSTLHETVGGNVQPDNGNLLLICQSCSKVFPARTINLEFLSLPCL